MNEILSLLIRANLVAAAAIGLILMLRPVMTRRFGPEVTYRLWALAPLAIAAAFLPARRIVMAAADVAIVPAHPAPLSVPVEAPLVAAPLATPFDATPWLLALWTAGALASLIVFAWRQHRFGMALGPLTREDQVYRTGTAGLGPAVIGALRPRIVVPSDFETRFNAEERAVVLAHEQVHFRRGDPLVNAAVTAARCLFWFNPMVHVAAFHLRLDQEFACDAAVVARFPVARKRYAEAMLKTQVSPMVAPLACYWPARSAHPMKQRIAMLKAEAPSAARRFAGLAVIAAATLGAGLTAWAAQPAQIETQASVRRVITPAVAAPADPATPAEPAERATPAEPAEPAAPVTPADPVTGAVTPSSDTLYQMAWARARDVVLADNRAPVTPLGRQLGRALVEAVAEGDRDGAAGLIVAGADVNHHTPGDGTPLIYAVRHDDFATARLLIAKGADVNKSAPGEGNALILAARTQKLKMAALLIAARADVNGFVLGDETPLINATRSGDLALVRYLIDHGADPNLAVPTGNFPGQMRSPLSVSQDPQITAYLKSRGARS